MATPTLVASSVTENLTHDKITSLRGLTTAQATVLGQWYDQLESSMAIFAPMARRMSDCTRKCCDDCDGFHSEPMQPFDRAFATVVDVFHEIEDACPDALT